MRLLPDSQQFVNCPETAYWKTVIPLHRAGISVVEVHGISAQSARAEQRSSPLPWIVQWGYE